jgi:uncharacterized protein YoxC
VHPYIAATIVVLALVVIIVMVRSLMQGVRRVFARLRDEPAASSG